MDKQKLYDIILYICDEIPRFQNGALKINKLIWFIESEYYRQHGKTITGVDFAAIDHGPIVNDYKTILEQMETEKVLSIDKQSANNWLFTAKRQPKLASLQDDEKLIVREMVSKLGALNSDSLEELSHKDAYYITIKENNDKMGKIIDMDLVLLESSPLNEPQKDIPNDDTAAIKNVIESHHIQSED